MSKQVLLIGASGFIGRRVLDRLEGRALATFRTSPIAGGQYFDSTKMRLRNNFRLESVSHAVLFLGESNTIACGLEPSRTDRINIDSIIEVLTDLREFSIKPLFISSDAVFDGRKGDYREDDPPHPVMRYGQQKLAVERYLAGNFFDYLIVRASKTYDSRPGSHLLGRWLDDIAARRTIRLATDHVFCPIHVDDLARAIETAIDANMNGIYHAGGPEKMTYWRLFHLLIETLGLAPDLLDLRPALINDFAGNEPRPINNSLLSDLFFERLGIQRRLPSEVCAELTQTVVAE
jgi:dTDP-4-dehydrorhamnose reductase